MIHSRFYYFRDALTYEHMIGLAQFLMLSSSPLIHLREQVGFKRWRLALWGFVEYPKSSVPARIWATCNIFIIVVSVVSSRKFILKFNSNCNEVEPKTLEFCPINSMSSQRDRAGAPQGGQRFKLYTI